MTEPSDPMPLWRRLQGWWQLSDRQLAEAMGVTTRTIYRRKQGQRWTKAQRVLLAQILHTDPDLIDITDDQVEIVLRPDTTSRVVIHHNRHCVVAGQGMLFDPAAALIAA